MVSDRKTIPYSIHTLSFTIKNLKFEGKCWSEKIYSIKKINEGIKNNSLYSNKLHSLKNLDY